MRHSIDQRDLIDPLRVCVGSERLIDFSHHRTKRKRLIIRHFRIIQKMPLRLDEQRAQRSQLPWRVADHPVLVFVDVPAWRGGFFSIMFAANETGFRFQIAPLNF